MEHRISIKTVQGAVLSLNEFKMQGLMLKDAIGVILQTPVIGMIISLDGWEEIWGQYGKLITSKKGGSHNLMDLSGLDLTKQIVGFQDKSDFDEMTAAKRCWEYHAGGLQWYLPSVYELCTMCAFWTEIRDTMISIGIDEDDIPERGYFWSSSENNNYNSVVVYFGTGTIYTGGKNGAYSVRAVSTFDNSLTCERRKQATFDLASTSDAMLVAEMRKRGFAGKIIKTFEL